MPRPKILRWVRQVPRFGFFRPKNPTGEVVLSIEEYETLRLKDFKGLEQKEAADKMGISQPTFARLLATARKKVAEALIERKSIRVGGGDYQMVKFRRGRGYGKGRMGGSLAVGSKGHCVCPECGYKTEHIAGKPCMQMTCPKCKIRMVRE